MFASRLTNMKKSTIAFALLLMTMAAMFVINLFFGSIHLDASEVMDALLGKGGDSVTRFVVVESRLPQALTAMLCGAGLAVSGLMLQTIFHNPLADPSILGVNSGASLGVAFVMLVLGGTSSTYLETRKVVSFLPSNRGWKPTTKPCLIR